MEFVINAVLVAVGLGMLCFGGNWLVGGGIDIAKRFGIRNIVIGMTVVAYGTSTPELAASIAAAGEHPQIILGNIVGSNIANIGMVIGVSAIMIPLIVNKATIRKELLVALGASVMLVLLSLDGQISRYDGALLIGLLIMFTIILYRSVKGRSNKGRDDVNDKNNTNSTRARGRIRLWSIGMLAVGIVFLYVGSEITIDNAVKMAQALNMSERVIGMTVVAVGTSLPELVTSIMAIRKGHADIGIGNIIGSNIYNILMIMGIASALASITIVNEIYFDYAVMVALSLVLLAVMRVGTVPRWVGICLVSGYVAYIAISVL